MLVRLLIYILPFVLSCIPGYGITSDIVIQSFDVYFAVIITILLFNHSKENKPKKLNDIMQMWSWFVAIIFISLVLNCLWQSVLDLSAVSKACRLLYPIFLVNFLWYFRQHLDRYFMLLIIISGIISASIAIYGYFFQIEMISASQTMLVNGIVMNRAGSFWGDSGMVGLLSCIYIIIGIILIVKSSFTNASSKILAYTCVVINLASLSLSYSRSGIVALFGTLCVMMFMLGKKKLYRLLIVILIFAIVLFILYDNKVYQELNFFIDSRILTMFETNSRNVNDISSGRIAIWSFVFDKFLDLDMIGLLVGKGYKLENQVYSMADNGYLYILISTGFIGFMCFLLFLVKIVKLYLCAKKVSTTIFLGVSTFLCWLLASMTVDVLTYTSINLFVFLFLLLVFTYNTNFKLKGGNENTCR